MAIRLLTRTRTTSLYSNPNPFNSPGSSSILLLSIGVNRIHRFLPGLQQVSLRMHGSTFPNFSADEVGGIESDVVPNISHEGVKVVLS
jgi:hypothetical protein